MPTFPTFSLGVGSGAAAAPTGPGAKPGVPGASGADGPDSLEGIGGPGFAPRSSRGPAAGSSFTPTGRAARAGTSTFGRARWKTTSRSLDRGGRCKAPAEIIVSINNNATI